MARWHTQFKYIYLFLCLYGAIPEYRCLYIHFFFVSFAMGSCVFYLLSRENHKFPVLLTRFCRSEFYLLEKLYSFEFSFYKTNFNCERGEISRGKS